MMKFACILADPPWPFRDQGNRASPTHAHYRVLSLGDILAGGWAVRQLAADDAFLWLWCPNALVLDGTARRVCRAYGFEPKQLIPWIKTGPIGLGHYTRVCSEMLVLATRGRPVVLRRNVKGYVIARRTKHSAKPDESYELIESLCAGPRLELYARRRYSDQWITWGNEAPDPHPQIGDDNGSAQAES